MRQPIIKRSGTGAMLVGLAMLLSACLLTPGKFASNLDLRKDGQFTFTYTGEMHLVTLSEFAQQNRKAGSDEVFQPEPCRAGNGGERECSTAELDSQMRAWEERQRNRDKRDAEEARQLSAMLGGFDPSDPAAALELTKSLRRQAGWKRVEYRGNGRFDVDFEIRGHIGHDFVFPTMERFPMANAFVQVSLRGDDTVRVDAPAYALSANPYQGLTQLAMMGQSSGAQSDGKKEDMPQLPVMDGTFTITTDGEILANNTEEGPSTIGPAGRSLVWNVNARSEAAPTALVRLTR